MTWISEFHLVREITQPNKKKTTHTHHPYNRVDFIFFILNFLSSFDKFLFPDGGHGTEGNQSVPCGDKGYNMLPCLKYVTKESGRYLKNWCTCQRSVKRRNNIGQSKLKKFLLFFLVDAFHWQGSCSILLYDHQNESVFVTRLLEHHEFW